MENGMVEVWNVEEMEFGKVGMLEKSTSFSHLLLLTFSLLTFHFLLFHIFNWISI